MTTPSQPVAARVVVSRWLTIRYAEAGLGAPGPVSVPHLPPDEVLVGWLRSGDRPGIREMADAWTPGMLRLVRLVQPDAPPTDVVGQVWRTALAGAHAYQGNSPKAWLFRILLERLAMPLQQGGDAPTVDPDRFQDVDEPYPEHWREFPDEWAEQDPSRLASDLGERLFAALGDLPLRQRVAIALTDLEGLPPARAASMLSRDVADFELALHAGRARLREWLADDGAAS